MTGEQRKETLSLIEKLITHFEKNRSEKQALNLCKWLKAYSWYLRNEKTFAPLKMPKYQRGAVVKVNFGYNVNHELGGVHYAVVLNNNNPQSEDLITIVPLTSAKEKQKLRMGMVPLGDELYYTMLAKIQEKGNSWQVSLYEIQKIYQDLERISMESMEMLQFDPKDGIPFSDPEWHHKLAEMGNEKMLLEEKFRTHKETIISKQEEAELVKNEFSFMKPGSVAMINQITTISKMRIRDPVDTRNALYGVSLSKEKLFLIDCKLREMFTR